MEPTIDPAVTSCSSFTSLLILLTLLPATGMIFNSSSLVLGVPVSILWLSGCFVAMAALTVIGYLTVFRPHRARIDAERPEK
ncbi:MAG: hypothetical protein O7H41_21160 [Planctomycetota bacterium]|nr:hypothetical protein [Planctomycetota bacterium]